MLVIIHSRKCSSDGKRVLDEMTDKQKAVRKEAGVALSGLLLFAFYHIGTQKSSKLVVISVQIVIYRGFPR